MKHLALPLLLLVLIAGLTGIFFLVQTPAPAPVTVYKNDKLGFTVVIPKEWKDYKIVESRVDGGWEAAFYYKSKNSYQDGIAQATNEWYMGSVLGMIPEYWYSHECNPEVLSGTPCVYLDLGYSNGYHFLGSSDLQLLPGERCIGTTEEDKKFQIDEAELCTASHLWSSVRESIKFVY